MLAVQSNLANTYQAIGRSNEALQMMRRDVYLGILKLKGNESIDTLRAACNYAAGLSGSNLSEETKALLRKMTPAARRVLGESHDFTFTMRGLYATALYMDASATLDDLRESVATFEDTARIARRTLGSAHPTTEWIEKTLQEAREGLRDSAQVNRNNYAGDDEAHATNRASPPTTASA
jgi:hypothetical protein